LAVVQRPGDGALLAGLHDLDAAGETHFCRLLGGGVEFGERSEETVRREMMEELGAAVRPIKFLGALENIFIYRGEQGHEVILNWLVEFEDPALYAVEEFTVTEDTGAANAFTHPARWVQPAELAVRGIPFYPDGIVELVAQTLGERHA
jgi:8-oxo-dGTP pyrophosphatase MutT (NUDIX family)